MRYEQVLQEIADTKKEIKRSFFFILGLPISVLFFNFMIYFNSLGPKGGLESILNINFLFVLLCFVIALISGFMGIFAVFFNLPSKIIDFQDLKKDLPLLEKDYKEVNRFEQDLQNCISENKFLIKEHSVDNVKIMFMLEDCVIAYQSEKDHFGVSRILKNGDEDLAFKNDQMWDIVEAEVKKILENNGNMGRKAFLEDIKEALKSNKNEQNSFEDSNENKKKTNLYKTSKRIVFKGEN